ncbi:hypothetical protein G6F47_013481 [Rhizopus delemar]|nr:hypothetical protein G6F54_012491 [Rhizopus delemar]KAG1515781.1 hypothetical protein G6F52_009599 [Rhizopus delemar]KAG1574877.1 hypothetical protein G6F47_013481 [Rhizopus delemar]
MQDLAILAENLLEEWTKFTWSEDRQFIQRYSVNTTLSRKSGCSKKSEVLQRDSNGACSVSRCNGVKSYDSSLAAPCCVSTPRIASGYWVDKAAKNASIVTFVDCKSKTALFLSVDWIHNRSLRF